MAAVTIAVAFVMSHAGVLVEDSSNHFHDGSVEPQVSTDGHEIPTGLTLFRRASGEDADYVLADLAVDEEFVRMAGDDWEFQSRELLIATNAVVAPLGVSIRLANVQQWRSDDSQTYISSHLRSVERQADVESGHMLLAVVGQNTTKYDGWAEDKPGQMIVHFYPRDPTLTHSLIAHELGHLLGARHHEDDEECTEDGCIMDHRGFAHAAQWCDHHLRVIRATVDAEIGVVESASAPPA